MTSFVDDNGNYLDYSGQDFGVTKQAFNLFEAQMKGDFSVNFKIPNTAKNRDVLGYYGAQQIDSPAQSRIIFNLVKDGNFTSRGALVITNSDERDISVFYISGNSNWFQSLQFNIKDVEFQNKFTVLLSDYDGRKAATEGIVLPLVDYFANGAKRSTNYVRINRSLNPEEGPAFTEAHPWIYLHTMVSEMATYAGVKIEGDLMDDPLYKKMIISPDGPDYYVPDSIVERSYALLQNGPFGSAGAGLYDDALDPQLVRFQTLVEGSGVIDTSTYSWFAPYTGTYRLDVDFWFNVNDTYSVELFVNGSLFTVLFNQAVTTRNKSGTAYANLVKGDKVQFYVNNSLAADYRLDYLTDSKYSNISIKLEKYQSVTPTANLGSYSPVDTVPYIIPNSIIPDMQAVDVIKFLVIYFGCSVSYDEFSKTISLNLIENFDRPNAPDWSEYFVSAVTKYDTKVGRNNYIQTKEGPEEDIVGFDAQSNLKYGGGNIETGFDSIEEKTLYTIPFSGSWDIRNKSYSKVFYPFVKFYDLELVESVAYSGVTNAAGFSQFTSTWNDPIEDTDIFYVISTSGIYAGFSPLYTPATSVTNPQLLIDYVSNDTGTIIKYRATKVQSSHRLMVCFAGGTISNLGGTNAISSVTPYVGTNAGTTITTSPLCWFDKPVLSAPLDLFRDSLAIDSDSNGISKRYYGSIKKAFNSPMIEATMVLPTDVVKEFSFSNFVYLKTKEINGYFLVQKIDNYKDSVTPVKVHLLYG